MSTPCLIGRQHGPDGVKAVYCHMDGQPSTMVPVLRRLVLSTFAGRPNDASHYLMRYSGFGYWSSLTGSGDAYSANMRADTGNSGPIHKITGAPWPSDVDVYQDNPDARHSVLEYRNGAYSDSSVINWGQKWLYILYPLVLAVVRYIPPGTRLANDAPIGVACDPLPWAQPATTSRLLALEAAADRKVEQVLAASHPSAALAA